MNSKKYIILSRFKIVIALFIVSNYIHAQLDISPYEYHDLMSVDSIRLHEKNGTLRSSRIQRNYTFTGEYSKSDSLTPAMTPYRFDSLTCKDLEMLNTYSKEDASHTIDSLSRHYNIILINEKHTYPFHRVFVHNLIDDLAKNGYSLIGLEALSRNRKRNSGKDSTEYNLNDTLLNTRGYPIYSNFTGTYTKEPQMGNLIRQGHKHNYDFFAYEKLGGNRELNQAKNIASFRRKFPDRKMIILCGNLHLAEDSIPGINVKLMGHYLNEELDEEILTIEQTRLSYHPIYNSKLYNYVDPHKSIVLKNSSGDYFTSLIEQETKAFDVSVFHPRFDKWNGRPDWLSKREGVKEIYINAPIKIATPFTIMARKADEPLSTPVDVVYITSLRNMKPLFLDPGKYTLELNNILNQSQNILIKVK